VRVEPGARHDPPSVRVQSTEVSAKRVDGDTTPETEVGAEVLLNLKTPMRLR
jgi:hypothetical protein